MSLRTIIITIGTLLIGSISATLGADLKDITYETESAGKVVFSHKLHLGKKGKDKSALNCAACHAEKKSTKQHYTMAQMEAGKSCGACHNGKKAFGLPQCARCHKVKEITYTSKQYGKVIFSHSRHLGKNNCNSCHSTLYQTKRNPVTTMAEMKNGKSCGACHNGKAAFAVSQCKKCHPYKDVSYKIVDAGDVAFSHEKHLTMAGCGDCHDKIFSTKHSKTKISMSDMEKGKSCGACHDGKKAFTVAANCADCHKVKKGSSLSSR